MYFKSVGKKVASETFLQGSKDQCSMSISTSSPKREVCQFETEGRSIGLGRYGSSEYEKVSSNGTQLHVVGEDVYTPLFVAKDFVSNASGIHVVMQPLVYDALSTHESSEMKVFELGDIGRQWDVNEITKATSASLGDFPDYLKEGAELFVKFHKEIMRKVELVKINLEKGEVEELVNSLTPCGTAAEFAEIISAQESEDLRNQSERQNKRRPLLPSSYTLRRRDTGTDQESVKKNTASQKKCVSNGSEENKASRVKVLEDRLKALQKETGATIRQLTTENKNKVADIGKLEGRLLKANGKLTEAKDELTGMKSELKKASRSSRIVGKGERDSEVAATVVNIKKLQKYKDPKSVPRSFKSCPILKEIVDWGVKVVETAESKSEENDTLTIFDDHARNINKRKRVTSRGKINCFIQLCNDKNAFGTAEFMEKCLGTNMIDVDEEDSSHAKALKKTTKSDVKACLASVEEILDGLGMKTLAGAVGDAAEKIETGGLENTNDNPKKCSPVSESEKGTIDREMVQSMIKEALTDRSIGNSSPMQIAVDEALKRLSPHRDNFRYGSLGLHEFESTGFPGPYGSQGHESTGFQGHGTRGMQGHGPAGFRGYVSHGLPGHGQLGLPGGGPHGYSAFHPGHGCGMGFGR